MTYVGQQPSTTFDSGIQDRFTGLSSNTVTLTHEISSEVDILVVWNNIVQDSGTYSVGGTGNKTLTLGGTLVSADVVTVYYLNKVMQSVNPTAGSVTTTTINDTAVTGAKLNTDVISAQTALGATPADTDELLVSDAGVLKRVDYSYLKGGDNNPSFMVVKTSSQSVTNNSATKVTWDSELKDSDSAFASDKFTVPSGKGGDYYIFATLEADAKNNSDLKVSYLKLYKNGSLLQQNVKDYRANQPRRQAQTLVGIHTLSASDYLELYSQIDSDDGDIEVNAYQASDGYGTIFGGFKLIT